MTLSRTIPALPVRNITAALAFYDERLGFPAIHSDGGFAVVARDGAEIHLWQASDDRWMSRGQEGGQSAEGHPIRSGAESFIAGTASCRIQTDDIAALYAELAAAKVLHPTDAGAPVTSDWGTVEFAILDLEGNLLTFFETVPAAITS